MDTQETKMYRLKQCKRTYSMYKYLIELRISVQNAWKLAKSSKGGWRMSLNPIISQAMPNAWFERVGLVSLQNKITKFRNYRVGPVSQPGPLTPPYVRRRIRRF
jgi:hypothetical protein